MCEIINPVYANIIIYNDQYNNLIHLIIWTIYILSVLAIALSHGMYKSFNILLIFANMIAIYYAINLWNVATIGLLILAYHMSKETRVSKIDFWILVMMLNIFVLFAVIYFLITYKYQRDNNDIHRAIIIYVFILLINYDINIISIVYYLMMLFSIYTNNIYFILAIFLVNTNYLLFY